MFSTVIVLIASEQVQHGAGSRPLYACYTHYVRVVTDEWKSKKLVDPTDGSETNGRERPKRSRIRFRGLFSSLRWGSL